MPLCAIRHSWVDRRSLATLGDAYREFLVHHLAHGQRGSADLCAHISFCVRSNCLRDQGQMGLLATNTIAQGDTREVGLDQLTNNGCVIPRAVPSRKWPGTASLEVAHVWMHRGQWQGNFFLDEQLTQGITAFLTATWQRDRQSLPAESQRRQIFPGVDCTGYGLRDGARRGPTTYRERPSEQGCAVPISQW